jgi:SAM-dependent methyltransferase
MLTLYRFPSLYRLLMRAGYGADYTARYALVADRLGAPDDVLELCCGPLGLHAYLARRGLLRSYVGLEQSPAMLRLAGRRGVDVRAFDVRAGGAFPAAGTLVMQASLYQFHDAAEDLLPRLWAAARRRLVVAEPVRSLAQSRFGAVRWLGRVLTRTPDRVHAFRYTEASLLELYRRCGVPVNRVDRTPGGREVVLCSVRAPSPGPAP